MLSDDLNNLLADQTDDGLVNFNAIAKRVSGIPAGVPTLLRKGGLNDIKTNLVNMNDGEEERVIQKKGTIYHTDPRLAVAFIKQNCKDLRDEVERWELLYGRADVPEQLGQSAPALLRHLMSVFDNTKFRCTFQDGKWWFCLHDVVQAATGDQKHTQRHVDMAYTMDSTLETICTANTKQFYKYVIIFIKFAPPGRPVCEFFLWGCEYFEPMRSLPVCDFFLEVANFSANHVRFYL